MGSDVAFTAGRSHRVCQDYGLAGMMTVGGNLGSWAMVADGCSSEPHTDVGARLLLHAAARQIVDLADTPAHGCEHAAGWLRSCVQSATAVADAMRLPEGALCATVLAVTTDADGDFRVVVGGDGVVVARFRAGGLLIRRYRFKNEMPFYPYYLTSRRRMAAFKAAAEADSLTIQWASLHKDPAARPQSDPWFDEYHIYDHYPYTEVFSARKYDAVAVLSDGADALRFRPENEFADRPPPLADVVRDLAGFKGLEGAFVQRRFNKALKEFAERGWWLSDDLAVGAVAAPLEEFPDTAEDTP